MTAVDELLHNGGDCLPACVECGTTWEDDLVVLDGMDVCTACCTAMTGEDTWTPDREADR